MVFTVIYLAIAVSLGAIVGLFLRMTTIDFVFKGVLITGCIAGSLLYLIIAPVIVPLIFNRTTPFGFDALLYIVTLAVTGFWGPLVPKARRQKG